jgi:hypothetical protein
VSLSIINYNYSGLLRSARNDVSFLAMTRFIAVLSVIAKAKQEAIQRFFIVILITVCFVISFLAM